MSGKDLLPPLARITPQDQRGVLWIIATICMVFIYLTLAARAFVRWRRFQPDDFAIFAACVLVLAQTSVSYAAVGLGLGLSRLTVSEDDVKTVWQVSVIPDSICHLVAGTRLLTDTWPAFHCKRGLVHRCYLHSQDSCALDNPENLATRHKTKNGSEVHHLGRWSARPGQCAGHNNQMWQQQSFRTGRRPLLFGEH